MKKSSMAIEKVKKTSIAIEKKKKRTSMTIEKHKQNISFRNRLVNVFKKADELAVLCEADVAVIVISADGTKYEFANYTSSVQKIIARFRKCYKTGKQCAPESAPEEPKEVDPTDNMENHILRKVLGKDLENMNLHEMFGLEERLNKGLLCIKDRKIEMLAEELERSRIHEQQVAQKNKILDGQIEELRASSEMECCYGRPAANIDHLPSTSSGYGRLPSTTSASDKQYCETNLSLAPAWAISGKDHASSSGASSSNFHSQAGRW